MACSQPFLKRRREERSSSTLDNSQPNGMQSARSQPNISVRRQSSNMSASSRSQSQRTSHTAPSRPSHVYRLDDNPTRVNRNDPVSVGRSSDSTSDGIIMALNYTDKSVIGCAYYNPQMQTLFMMQDLKLGDPSIVQTLCLDIHPSVVLLPASCTSEIVDMLNPGNSASTTFDQDSPPASHQLFNRPSNEFGFEAGKNKLLNLRIGQNDGPLVSFITAGEQDYHNDQSSQYDRFENKHGRLLRLSAWIDIESNVTVGCAGAILSYLRQRRAETFLPGDQAAALAFAVSRIEMFTLADTLLINTDTLHALQIISTEVHPNAQQQGPPGKGWSAGSKEGLSIYGLFHHFTKTPQGRQMLRQYFLRPSTDIDVINTRLLTIDVLTQPENDGVLQQLTKILAKVNNMRITTQNLRKGVSGSGNTRTQSGAIWSGIRLFVYNALCITDAIRDLQMTEMLPIVADIQQKFSTSKLAEIGQLVSGIIDLDASQEQHKAVVQPGIDAELDEARRIYEGIEELLSRVAEHTAANIPAELEANINVIFFPQIGFLVSVRYDADTGSAVFEGLDEDRWDRMFVTDSAAYYKNAIMRGLDQEYGDIYGKIADREIEIVQALAERILQDEEMLISISDTCGRLDCLVALAQGAKQYGLQRPEMTDQNIVKIRDGRHILQECVVSAFVPNPTDLQGGAGVESVPYGTQSAPSMLILTGPNYSGKSIYLKQVALIVYMAHIGSFVPASHARIGITDRILTRITTRESASKTSSAFMIDLQQICLALKQATRRSLLIIDEFGKGTEAEDGAGLAAGVFHHLLQRGVEAPKVLAATQHHEIFENGFLKPRPGLDFGHMDVRIDEHATSADQQITYLYTYKAGRSVQSFGTCCAAMNGISPAVIARAERLLLISAKCDSLVEACSELPADELAELEEAENTAREFLGIDSFDNARVLLGKMLEYTNQDIDERLTVIDTGSTVV